MLAAPKPRPRWRRRLGRCWYILRRRVQWWRSRRHFARLQTPEPLPYVLKAHQSPLLRQLKAVDMVLQYNKITNLRLAAAAIDGLVLRPGEIFSFWRRVGRPSARRGFLEGLVLDNGRVSRGVGGGLCQMGNLLYWMALHTPLTVTERYRHSYDVFPDEGRTLPFGSGATLAWNYIDLQLRNDTAADIQLRVWLDERDLHGEIRTVRPFEHRYEVFEAAHEIRHEAWGGYSRHNRIARRIFAADGRLLAEETVTDNHALMMYQPFLPGSQQAPEV